MKFKSLMYAALLVSTSTTWAADIPAYIQAAVADASRPSSDTERDVNRKPAEVLTFSGVKPGDKVGELMPGRGYFTKLFCKIVGEQGHVYAVNVTATQPMGPPSGGAGMDAMGAGPQVAAEPAKGTPCTNVSEDAKPAAEFSLPSGLDLVWTSENYHDLHNDMFGKPDMLKFNQAVFAALKPGGVYMIEDHAAQTGSGTSATDTLHRIDPEQVKQEVTAAGFVFEASSEVLHNADDPLTVKTFELNGQSSKFLFKFRKPAQ